MVGMGGGMGEGGGGWSRRELGVRWGGWKGREEEGRKKGREAGRQL